jgi:hypothetical protein
MWEGWVEFTPTDGTTEVLVTGIESRQPERTHPGILGDRPYSRCSSKERSIERAGR